ncbi:MAG: LPXTG cell wall anchor domain-containing protein, partial [Lachnospiraceae bacterium]|nr:LPXTG cell wall anchor domain-containing protein [Lachnospiraceae bacterium]
GKGTYYVDPASESNTVTSDKEHDGLILIYGLDPKVIYKLTETATEDGYNLLDGAVTPTIVKAETGSGDAAKNTIKVKVGEVTVGSNASEATELELTATQILKIANNQGATLPSTGGIGTTIFYIIGAILVIGAGVLLVTKRRMRAE